MNSVIISDYGVMLAKKGERLVIRGPKPRLELIEGALSLCAVRARGAVDCWRRITRSDPRLSPAPMVCHRARRRRSLASDDDDGPGGPDAHR